ncbi:Ion channel, partial [Ostertagia ostertagi]
MAALVVLLLLYPFVGGICIHNVSQLSLFDSIYYCCITILTVGYGDIEYGKLICTSFRPPISVPYLILFIFVGVTLVTISVDVVATNIIHQVHYMGRRMGQAKVIADKMMQMAQKISINRGLGLGMAQLGAFARMGVMINLASNGKKVSRQENGEGQRVSTAYDPDYDLDLIDRLSELNKYYQNYNCILSQLSAVTVFPTARWQ